MKNKKLRRIKSNNIPMCRDPILGLSCEHSVINDNKIRCPFNKCDYRRCLDVEHKIAVLIHIKINIARFITYIFGPTMNWKRIPEYPDNTTPEIRIAEKILEIIIKGCE